MELKIRQTSSLDETPSLLNYLPLIDFFLDCPAGEQPIYHHLTLLSNPPSTLSSLCIRGGIPVGIEYKHSIRTGQVYSQASHSCGEEEEETVLWALGSWSWVKFLHKTLALPRRCATIHAQVGVATAGGVSLQDVQHLLEGELEVYATNGHISFSGLSCNGLIRHTATTVELKTAKPAEHAVQFVKKV